jgi:hypothetical protein
LKSGIKVPFVVLYEEERSRGDAAARAADKQTPVNASVECIFGVGNIHKMRL